MAEHENSIERHRQTTMHGFHTMVLLILDSEKDIPERLAVLSSFVVCVVRYDMIHLEVKVLMPEMIPLELL